MKSLILVRHGKSDWQSDSGVDHDRPLAPRGVKAARLMGRFLTAAGLAPERVLSSTAVRARTTAELAHAAGGWDCPLDLDRALYAASVSSTLDVLRRVPGDPERLLLVGHEPTWSGLGGALTGGSDLAVVTAAAVGIELGVRSWGDLEPNRGRLRFLLPPRLLGAVMDPG
ncbi:MAG: histidine phosphatase family protein [Acidobacteriota bacterium]